MIYIGIDPGASGGIAIIDSSGEVLHCWKMPGTERDILECFSWADHYTATFAVIEKVHAMPKQGVSSTFKFGMSYGFLRGCLVAAEIPFEAVAPGVWQKAMGCLSKGDKNVTKAKAQELFPSIKVTHAIADALLIAEYARRIHKQRNT